MFYDHYPYTNFHNVNLDWVLQAVKAWGQTVEANDRAFRDLQEANEDFKAYVTHYLQDLDVSDEINAKLDAMLAAGTLTPYFRPYIASEVSSWLTGHITPTTPALDNTLKVVNAAAESSHTGEALNDLAYTALRGDFRELKAIVPGSIAPGYRIQSIVRNYTNGKYYLVGGSNAHDGTGVIITADGPDLNGAVVTVVDQLGHANDVTYYEGFLYVCTAGNDGAAEGDAPLNKVWRIDVNDFTSKTLVTGTPDGIYGITYDYGRFYMLANNKIYYADTNFENLTVAVDNIYSFTTPGGFPTSGRLIQGLFTYPNHVIGLVSDYVVEGTHNGTITFFTRQGLMIAARTFESVNAEVQGACTGTNGSIIVVTSNETELSTVLIQRLFDRDYEIIPDYADLDDYRASGTYYCNVRETAGSLTHCPTKEAFTMEVHRLGMLHVSQEITDMQARVYIRTGNGRTGAWGEWTDVAGEITQIKEDLGDVKTDVVNSVLEPSVNLADPAEFVKGKYMLNTGAVGNSSGYFYTGKISVAEGDVIYSTPSPRYYTAFNGENVVVTDIKFPWTVPSGINGLIVTVSMSAVGNLMITKNRLLPYIPYSPQIDNNYLNIENQNAINGNDGITAETENLEALTTSEITAYPKGIATHDRLSGYCEFSELGEIEFGYGYTSNYFVKIDATNIYRYYKGSVVGDPIPHGLTITDYIMFSLIMGDDRTANVTINTTGGNISFTFSLNYGKNGLPFMRSTTALSNVKLSALSADIRKSIWWFGDSYSSNAPERVIGQLNQLGVIGNMLINAVPGMRSYYDANTGGYVDFIKLINMAKPKYVIWSYGMNDTEANYKGFLLRVKNICDVYNIELYAVKVPSVPNIDNSGKNAYIDELGIKSIDWAKAVGATSAGVWREGYLSNDNVHPTVKGAQAMAARTLVDCPALMQF